MSTSDERSARAAAGADAPAPARPARLQTATLGGGCFWCLEAVFEELRGVTRITSGYAGGHTEDPTYAEVCTGTTGHAEVVQVEFDPAELSYADLLRVFFSIHDPTTVDRQGGDIGPQYRSIILYHDDAQRAEAEAVMTGLEHAGIHDAPIVTQLEPLRTFYPAEPYHQEYYRRNPQQAYCSAVIAPKLAKFRLQQIERLKK